VRTFGLYLWRFGNRRAPQRQRLYRLSPFGLISHEVFRCALQFVYKFLAPCCVGPIAVFNIGKQRGFRSVHSVFGHRPLNSFEFDGYDDLAAGVLELTQNLSLGGATFGLGGGCYWRWACVLGLGDAESTPERGRIRLPNFFGGDNECKINTYFN
jgi:hypothetical protein